MKKILPLFILGILILGGIGAVGIDTNKEKVSIENNTTIPGDRATHTVLGEYGTATWCGYCRYAHGALKELYAEGQLDFYYITHVYDKNSISSSYLVSHYNLYGFPTIWWDGGRDVDVGAGSIPAAKTTYTSSINYCGSQPVYDVDIVLTVTWLSGTEMQVDCTVNNNEANTYDGTIQVAICEKVSSRGWIDTGGVTYTMPFLDWAFKEPISISAGGSWSDSMTWDGTSHGYPTVTKENTIVIAAVYNDEVHQGYSYPPSSNPFNAYYVDDCVAAEPATSNNNPPETPDIDGPVTGVPGTTYDFTLTTVDPDGDDIRYYVMWDDGDTEWTGYASSGDIITVTHSYGTQDTYTIKARAEDTNYGTSDWATFEITIPRTRDLNHLLLNFLQRFPILRQILSL